MNIQKILSGEAVASKSEAIEASHFTRIAIKDGAKDALPFFVAAKYFEEYFANITKDAEIKAIAITEIERHAGGYLFNGSKVELGKTVQYDYSTTPAWVDIENQIAALKELQKQIETAAKAIPDSMPATILVTEDGEEIAVFKPIKKVTDTIKTTLKK
jgi:hypothetical protein